MRKDMKKVITEAPRRHDWGNAKGRHKDKFQMDELPMTVPMSKDGFGFHKKTKEFSDHLGPLHRFIHSRVGKPWNKVYSEICENIKPTTTVQKHVLDHVKWMVETKTFIGEDGEIYSKSYNGQIWSIGTYSGREFYVHPTTGILCVAETRSHKYKRKEPDWRKVISDELQLHRIDGIWYEVWLRKFPVYEKKVPSFYPGIMNTVYEGSMGLKDAAYDLPVFSVGNVSFLEEKYGKRGWFCYKKVQLNSKSLKKHNVRNIAA